MSQARGGPLAAQDALVDRLSQAALIRRLRRVEGQVKGLQKMVATDRDRVEILTLVAQARGALQSVAALVLEAHLIEGAGAVDAAGGAADHERRIARVVKVFRRWAT